MSHAPFRQAWLSCRPEDVAARLYDGWHLDRITSARNPQNGQPTQVAIMRKPLVLGDEDLPMLSTGIGRTTRAVSETTTSAGGPSFPLAGATGILSEPTGCADDCTHPDHGHRA